MAEIFEAVVILREYFLLYLILLNKVHLELIEFINKVDAYQSLLFS
jgi:hypothetical protein